MINNIEQSRTGFNSLGENYSLADKTKIIAQKIAGIQCYWVGDTELENNKRILVYIHGGCFCIGSIESHKAMVSHLSNETGLRILFIEYGLAPEKPFPQGANDVVSVIEEVLHTNPSLKIVMAGDSAGGGIIITAMPRINKISSTAVESCVLISPWVDLSCSSDSYDKNAEIDPILSQAGLNNFAELYISDGSKEEANPAKELDNTFPPTLIMVGTNEVLLDDSKLSYERIKKNQDNVRLSIYEGQTHVWPMDSIEAESTKSALKEITNWCRKST